ncbi:MAG: nucleotidyltransferase family protein, partial [Clostridiales bacterium]|nr:nucleotidyltransferase family protein [Clostridiales bacterium]
DSLIREKLSGGVTYAVAREKAVKEIAGKNVAGVLKNPNDTLAAEYMAAFGRLKSEKKYLAVKRRGAGHDMSIPDEGYLSASGIREFILKGDGGWESFVPETTSEIILSEIEKGRAPVRYERLYTSVLAALRTAEPDEIKRLPDISEGLENRISDAAKKAVSFGDFLSYAKTKRYTMARIKRIALHAFLGITDEMQREEPPYIRVLAFNDRGREILRKAKDTASLPVIMRSADIEKAGEKAKAVFKAENRASDIYSLAMPNVLPCGEEYRFNVIRDHNIF